MTLMHLARFLGIGVCVLVLAACGADRSAHHAADRSLPNTTPRGAVATFAGGCFWCMEQAFDRIPGVLTTINGYMGGTTPNPTYEDVATGRTGHAEVVQVEYDPAVVSYEKLLDVFWRNVDPTDAFGQFCDSGTPYRAEIFVHSDAQRRAAEASRERLVANKPFPEPIVARIVAAGAFTAAEDYHQDYYVKNPSRYRFYRFLCGRDDRLRFLWDAPPN